MNNELMFYVYGQTLPSAYSLLPAKMASREASAMLLAIGLQESRFAHRRQVGPGPARGLFQFERNGGVKEILTHPVTGPLIRPIAELFLYKPEPMECHLAIENNDVLAACFARLLLWVDPRRMPSPLEMTKGWDIYLANWRPGKPHPGTWPGYYRQAWAVVGS